MAGGSHSDSDSLAIDHLRQSISEGSHWYVVLLEAISLWTKSEEIYNGRHYRYLIAGQAFDWLLLAERLCSEIDDLIPQEEKIDLLFGSPPLEMTREEFKGLIGNEKYQAHLNYFYGVVVEQALHLAVQTEVEKEQVGAIRRKGSQADIFGRIYGLSEATLLEQFRDRYSLDQVEEIDLTTYHEFIYWLFKYRVEHSDSARLASDTKKALRQLDQLEPGNNLPVGGT